MSQKCKVKKGREGNFHGGPVVKNPSFNAVPGQGVKILHAMGQLK